MDTISKRALVLSGGGAKGVFEAGVLQACHYTGLTFDIVTGSSIGAINAVLFAEYLRRRQQDAHDAARFFDYFSTIWEDLDAANLVDFDLLEPLVKDLAKVNIGLDDLLRIWWGFTGVSLGDKIRAGWHTFWLLTELDDILPLSLKDTKELFDAWQDEDRRAEVTAYLRTALRQFLAKHNAERGLFDPVSLNEAMTKPYDDSGVPPLATEQGLSSFRTAGIDVRLTRTNIRSGRLEISAHRTVQEILRRIAADPGDAADVIIGDPNAVNAALASGAFPVAFVPRTLAEIYPPGSHENDAQRAILAGPGEAAAFGFTPAQQALLTTAWPKPDDLYLDGGAIDNHPLSAAIDAIKDTARRARSAQQADQVYRASHDVFVIFLGPKPEVDELKPGEAQGMLAYEYGLRAYNLMQNAKMADDARTAERITQLMEQAAGWRDSDRPNRIKVNVNRIYPDEMLTGTLSFHRRMGFSRERNRQLLAAGCAKMLDVLAEPPNLARLEDGVRQKLHALRDLDITTPHGWRCTNLTCRVRDACTRT
ncbi:MAG: patatin-like phospholipase family protein [Anaerolineae bacterium]